MKKALKGRLAGCTLVLFLVVLGTVIGGDVTIQEGTIEGEKFKSTGCTATGIKAIAFGDGTTASGMYSTAMGWHTTASGQYSTAMGYSTTASGDYSIATGMGQATGEFATAMGAATVASADLSTALGYFSHNSVPKSLTVGFGDRGGPRVDFRVKQPVETPPEPKVYIYGGDLDVDGYVYCDGWGSGSSFYDKDTCGSALAYLEDSSKTVRLNAEGLRIYNHEGDPAFLKIWVTLQDYDKYTEEEVWDEELKQAVIRRNYQTHQELRSDEGMKIAWLRQCVFELKQQNDTLKAELAAIKEHIGMK